MKLLSNLQVIEVCKRFLTQRSGEVGQPLQKFKASGGLLPTGALNWRCGSYILTFAAKRLTQVKFRNGDIAAVLEDHVISDEFKLIRNY